MVQCLSSAEILRYLGGQLTPEEAHQADVHLASCPACSSRLAVARDVPPSQVMSAQAQTQLEVTACVPGEPVSQPSHWSDLGNSVSESAATLRPRPASLSVDDFLTNLSQSGLLPPPDLASVRQQSVVPPTNTVTTLIDWLIQEHKLTRYQAELIIRGQKGGLILGNYMILEKLGQGGMGTVFKAKHRRMNRLVALKVLPSSLANIPEAIARFQREMEAVGRLQHMHVAAAYDADEAEGVHFLAMEYVDGPNLASYVRHHGEVPLPAVLKLMSQAAYGLAAAHAQGVVHRDIKPSNLMVNRQGQLKVLDLGLAQMRGQASPNLDLTGDVTQTGRVMGTVDYMAPEQARDAKNVDFRADMYSLGCTLYFLATGKTPAPGGSAAEKLLWHQTQDLPPLSRVVPAASPRLDALLAALMAKEPADRPASMEAVATEFEACLAEFPAGDAELVIGEIAQAIESPGSTLGGSRFAQKTLIQAEHTLASASRHRLPGANTKSRALVYTCGFVGAAVLAAIVLAPMLAKTPQRYGIHAVTAPSSTLVVEVADGPADVLIDGQFKGRAGGAAGSLELALPAGALNVQIRREGYAPHDEQVTIEAAKRTRLAATLRRLDVPPSASLSPHAPYRDLLTWVFSQGGTVIANTGKGQELTFSASDQLPPEPLDIKQVRLEETGTRDDDLSRLAAVPGLSELSLADTQITDAGLVHLERLRQLNSLNLSRTRITRAGLDSLTRLSHLIVLDLSKTEIGDQNMVRLTGLPKLERLNLSDTRITDSGIAQLHGCKRLTDLWLSGTGLSDSGHAALVAALPDANITWDGADLQRSVAVRLLDKGATLGVLDHARQLHSGLKTADELPPGRVTVTLVDLSSGASFTDADLKELVKLPEIETLSLVGAAVTPEGLGSLHSLDSLKTLDLGAMRVPTAAVTGLRQALTTCQIQTKEPADVAVARMVIGRKGSVSLVTERGVAYDNLADDAKLPTAAYSVRSINFDGIADVDDAALTQFAELPELESLFLGGTAVTDEGVAQLATCKTLRELSLSGTKITAAGVGVLTRLPALARLYLADTAIGGEGARQAAALPALTHLSLQGVKLADDDLALLKRPEKLEWLDISNTPVSDTALVHLNQLKSLQVVNISGTGISDAGQEELQATLTGRRVIGDPLDPQRLAARWLVQNKATLSLESGPLTNVKGLPKGACRVLAIDIAELRSLPAGMLAKHLAACTDVVSLNLANTALTEADLAFLATLPELRDLRLNSLPIGDATLKLLAESDNLELLDLSGTRVTGAGLASLSNATELKHLLLAGALVEERYLTSLAQFAKLECLDVSASRGISDAGLNEIDKLRALKELRLRNTKITDAACHRVAQLAELEKLDLGANKLITDGGVSKLAACKKLRQIGLARTAVTDGVTGALGQIKSLKQIDLAGNRISAESIKSLRAALPGCVISEPAQAPMGDELNNGGSGRIGQFEDHSAAFGP